jgi:hypothetical protein
MEINVFTSEYELQGANQNVSKLTDIYYPCLVTNWEVSYKSLFKKQRTHKRVIFTNLIKGDSSFGNENPESRIARAKSSTVMEAVYSELEARENAKEMLRRYYMHYVRVWSVPEISCLSESTIYFPYAVLSAESKQRGKSRVILYEPVSNLTDKLAKFPEIEQFYQMQQRG